MNWDEWNERQLEALRELKEAIWDEGEEAGQRNFAHEYGLAVPYTTNPYRKETQ